MKHHTAHPPTRRLPLCIAIAAALATASIPQAHAATRTWDGAAGSANWDAVSSDGVEIMAQQRTNWSAGYLPRLNLSPTGTPGPTSYIGLPDSGDALVFQGSVGLNNTNTYTDFYVSGITFAAGAGPFALGGNALTSTGNITNNSSTLQTLYLPMVVGANQTWDGGTAGMSFNGLVNIRASELILRNGVILTSGDNPFTVGAMDTAALTIAAGSVVTSTRGIIGDSAAGNGTVTVTGAGSQWNSASGLTVGNGGTGTLNIESGGVVNSVTGFVAYGGSGTVRVSGAGSQWNMSETLSLGGFGGTGSLRIENGGVVNNVANHIQNVDAGSAADGGLFSAIGNGSRSIGIGTGTVTVTGAGSQWNNPYGLYVGNGGTGTLAIESGGVVSNGNAHVGNGGSGTVRVSGAGSQWNNGGWLKLGAFGSSATLGIENSGVVNSVTGFVGVGGNASVRVSGAGSQWNVSEYMAVGDVGGTGSLRIENGGVVNNRLGNTADAAVDRALFSILGRSARSTGTFTVTGAGSQWNNAYGLSVGKDGGRGTLNIENGGVVNNVTAYIGDGGDGGRGSSGIVKVSGAGSQWNNAGWSAIGMLGGTGTLNIENGGVVSNHWSGNLGVGAGSTGTVTVSGAGSQWNLSEYLAVGDGGGTGTLTIDNGGVVNNLLNTVGAARNVLFGAVGYRAGSTGTVTVTGAGSQWNNAYDLYVGAGGSGTLNIDNGGVVNNVNGYIGNGSNGTVIVSGAGSQWNTAASLKIATSAGSTGSLHILDAGKVTAQALEIGAQGTVNLDGGSLQVAGGSIAAGGVFNWIKGSLGLGGDASLGSGLLASTTTLTTGKTLGVAKTLFVNGDSTLILNGGQVNAGSLNVQGQVTVGTFGNLSDSSADLQLVGGTLGGAGALVNDGSITGFGVIAGTGGFTNNALLTQAGGTLTLRNTGANSNAGNWDMAAGRQLQLDGATLANTGMLNLNGGSVTGSGTLSNNVGGTVAGRGVISTGFVNAGRLVVDNGVTTVTKAFSNSGQILLGSNSATLAGGSMDNSGLIQGLGQLNNAIHNTGTVHATGGMLALNGKLTNSGILAADAGATLFVTSGLGSNAGQVQLAGGTLDNHGFAMTNEATGTISGAGSLRSGLLTNNGQLQLSAGTSTVYADVAGTSGSKIILSGQSNTTFYGTVEVKAGSELRVSQGSVATFFSQVQQRTGSNFTGTGTKLYEGGLSVGASPGLGMDAGNVTFGDANIYLAEIGGTTACTLLCGTDDSFKNSSYDKYVVGGKLGLGGTLKLASWNGYVAQAGQSFDLLDWGSTAGSFAHIDASGLMLAAGTTLDYSQLYTSGTISVTANVTAVPEPESYAMLLAGLAVLGTVARRRRAA